MPNPGRAVLIAGAALLALLLGGRAAAELYTEVLWFDEVGFTDVFWTRLRLAIAVQAAAALVGGGFVLLNLWSVSRRLGPIRVRRRYGNIEIAEQIPRRVLILGILTIAVLAGWWLAALAFGGSAAVEVAAWLNRVGWGLSDPVFRRDVGFYVFALPIYLRFIDFGLLVLVWTGALVLLGNVLVGAVRWRENRLEMDEGARLHLSLLLAGVVALVAVRYWFGRYGLLLGGYGFNGALGYTDVNIRLPAYNILALLSVVVAGAVLYGAWKRNWIPTLAALGTLVAAVLVLGALLPSLVQRFRVEPNEFSMESRYIEWNMVATRRAYDLHRLERQSFPYRPGEALEWERLSPFLSQLPVWDPEPLDTIFNSTQTLYGYFTFPDVDFDRYGETPAQVGIGVREFRPEGLGESSRTWQTLRLNPQYIRGPGVVASPAAEIQPDRGPQLWLSDFPPRLDPQAKGALEVTNPSVFFGETMAEYVIVIPGRDGAFTGTAGRDYPAGVRLGSMTRLLAFAWRFGDANLLLSGELTDDSRFVFRRVLQQRLRSIAPFLLWDSDPHPVVWGGRVVWIVDGYTASGSYPLARPVRLEGAGWVRYIRNSVKATVDAVTGEVALYAIDAEDPVLHTYARVFPGLFSDPSEMPEGLRAHLLYPKLLLRLQSGILRDYHLQRADRFYAGEDLWALPRVTGEAEYRPLYALLRLPGQERAEFVLSVPFIARERENMTALLVARNDPPNYGELVLYELPREQQIPGPVQVSALIEQDPAISQAFSLWRGAGSTVELGRMRIVPLETSFLYIQPVFLSSQDRSIPTLERIVVSDGREVVMASTLRAAVEALGGGPVREAAPAAAAAPPALPSVEDWPERALELLEEAEQRLRAGDWAGFGERWSALQRLLEGLAAEQAR